MPVQHSAFIVSFNQEKSLIVAVSVIVKTDASFAALIECLTARKQGLMNFQVILQ